MEPYKWCTKCQNKIEQCLHSEHRDFDKWRSDFLVGGARGKRPRKLFKTRDLAKAFTSQMSTDFIRGKLLPMESQSKWTFNQLVEEWYNKYAVVRLKTPSIELYHTKALAEMFGNKPISMLSHTDGEEFIEWSIKQGYKKGAINRNLTTLKSIFQWAVQNKYLVNHPFKTVKKLKEDESRVRWLSETELQKLLTSCHKLEDYSLVSVILFGVYTGFRRGNLERVTAQDINGNCITAIKTKSGKPYDVPISENLRSLVGELVRKNPTGPLLNTKELDKRFRAVVKDAGLWNGARDPQTVSLHTLRHTFASWYLKNGGDLYKLQKMMGHSSVKMTERYGHLSRTDIESQADKLNFTVEKKVILKIA